MKLHVNFTKPYGEYASILVVLIISLSLVLVYVSMSKLIEAKNDKRQLIKLKSDTKKYKQHVRKISKENINKPTTSELNLLKAQIHKQSEITSSLHTSILPLMSRLEVLLPANVYLTAFESDVQSLKIKIVAISDNISGISDFLTKLEKDKLFSSVLLKRQTTIKVNGIEKVEFELSITERSSI